MAACRGEVEFLVKKDLLFLFRQVLQFGLIIAGAAQLYRFLFVHNNLTVLTENTLKSRHDRCYLDDLLDESGNFSFKLCMIRLIYYFPVVFLLVKHGKNSENRHNFLRISMNVLLEILETIFYGSFQRFCQLLVQFFQKVQPLSLNMLLAGEEEFFVGGYELCFDNDEIVFECVLLVF